MVNFGRKMGVGGPTGPPSKSVTVYHSGEKKYKSLDYSFLQVFSNLVNLVVCLCISLTHSLKLDFKLTKPLKKRFQADLHTLFVCLSVYSRLSNFSAIRRLSPLPVTGLQI
jgi:hypothetical protein